MKTFLSFFKILLPCSTDFYFAKTGGGANNPLPDFNALRLLAPRLSLLAAILLAFALPASAQPAYSFNCPSGGTPSWHVEILPISTPTCGAEECNLKYFQVRLKTGLSFPGNPASFLLKYDNFSLTIKTTTDPTGGLSAVNQDLTEDCYPSAYQGFQLGFDPGNEVTFHLEGDCSVSTTPNILFTRAGMNPPYIADLFVIAVEGVPGEVILFELTQSYYTCSDVPVYCTDNLILDSDAYTFPSPSGSEPNVPVNQSQAASVELCLTQGQIRRTGSSTCRNACLDTDCAEINFGGFEPCDPNNFTVVVEAEEMGSTCAELEVKVKLNWSSYASALDFDQIRIAVEFDLPSGVTIDQIGANTFGCPTNPTCNPGGGFDTCFSIDGNLVTFCFFPNTAQSVDLGDYFTVLFDAPSNCINGVTVRESMVDVSTSPPGGSECVTNVAVDTADFPLCTPLFAGWVKNTDGEHVDDVDIKVSRVSIDVGCPDIWIWPNNIDWSHCPCDAAQYRVKPKVRNNDEWLNGVTTYDGVLIRRHLDGSVPFTTIYQYAAADADGNNRIDNGSMAPDIELIRDLVLGIVDTFEDQTSWRYFKEISTGTLPLAPPDGVFSHPDEYWQGAPSNTALNFIAVKIGDVNNSHNNDLELPLAGILPLRTEVPSRPAAGEYLNIPIRYEGAVPLTALQMGLRFDAALWEYVGITASDVAQVSKNCFNLNHVADGEIKFAWFCSLPDDYARPGQTMFFLTLRAKTAISGNIDPIQVDDAMLRSIAYTPEGMLYNLDMQAAATRQTLDSPSAQNLQVICAPNPSSGAASLTISTANETNPTATVWAYSAFGTRLLRREIPLTGRTTTFLFPESEHWPAGLYVWKVKVGDEKTEGRLIKQ